MCLLLIAITNTPRPGILLLQDALITCRRSLSFRFVPYLRRLNARFPTWKSRFKPAPFCVGFVVGQNGIRTGFYPNTSLLLSPVRTFPLVLHIHSSQTLYSLRNWNVLKYTHTFIRSFKFPHHNPVCNSVHPGRCLKLHPSHDFWFDDPTSIWWGPCHEPHSRPPHRWGPISISGQSLWDFWCAKWH
jgi:hypothetical protein